MQKETAAPVKDSRSERLAGIHCLSEPGAMPGRHSSLPASIPQTSPLRARTTDKPSERVRQSLALGARRSRAEGLRPRTVEAGARGCRDTTDRRPNAYRRATTDTFCRASVRVGADSVTGLRKGDMRLRERWI